MSHALARTLCAALLATVACGVAPAAAYVDDDEAREEGRCARGITWEMRAEPDDGRIELEVKVDTERTGRRWSWVLTHNGSLSDRGASWTKDSSGSFEIELIAVDVSGPDTFRLRASRKAVVCVARVTL